MLFLIWGGGLGYKADATMMQKSANRDGRTSDARLGPAVSKRVWKIFTGRDEGSTDI